MMLYFFINEILNPINRKLMKSLSRYDLEGSPIKRQRLENSEKPRVVTLTTDIWLEVFYILLSDSSKAGARLAILHCVSRDWDKKCIRIKLRLFSEHPFESIIYLPRIKSFDKITSAAEIDYMFQKWNEMSPDNYKENFVDEFLADYDFVDELTLGCSSFLKEWGGQITSLQLNSTLCGPLLEKFRVFLPHLEILKLNNVSEKSYETLAKMTQLKMLTVDQIETQKVGIQRLSSLPNLISLCFNAAEKDDISCISKFANLTMLKLTKVGANWPQIVSSLHRLEDLQIYGLCPDSWDCVSQLTNLTNLTFNAMNFIGEDCINNEALISICKLTNLKKLSLDFCNLSDCGLEHLSALTNLNALRIKSKRDALLDTTIFFYSFTQIQDLILESHVYV